MLICSSRRAIDNENIDVLLTTSAARGAMALRLAAHTSPQSTSLRNCLMSPFFFGPRHITCGNQTVYGQCARGTHQLPHGRVRIVEQEADTDNGDVIHLLPRLLKRCSTDERAGQLRDKPEPNPAVIAVWTMHRRP